MNSEITQVLRLAHCLSEALVLVRRGAQLCADGRARLLREEDRASRRSRPDATDLGYRRAVRLLEDAAEVYQRHARRFPVLRCDGSAIVCGLERLACASSRSGLSRPALGATTLASDTHPSRPSPPTHFRSDVPARCARAGLPCPAGVS